MFERWLRDSEEDLEREQRRGARDARGLGDRRGREHPRGMIGGPLPGSSRYVSPPRHSRHYGGGPLSASREEADAGLPPSYRDAKVDVNEHFNRLLRTVGATDSLDEGRPGACVIGGPLPDSTYHGGPMTRPVHPQTYALLQTQYSDRFLGVLRDRDRIANMKTSAEIEAERGGSGGYDGKENLHLEDREKKQEAEEKDRKKTEQESKPKGTGATSAWKDRGASDRLFASEVEVEAKTESSSSNAAALAAVAAVPAVAARWAWKGRNVVIKRDPTDLRASAAAAARAAAAADAEERAVATGSGVDVDGDGKADFLMVDTDGDGQVDTALAIASAPAGKKEKGKPRAAPSSSSSSAAAPVSAKESGAESSTAAAVAAAAKAAVAAATAAVEEKARMLESQAAAANDRAAKAEERAATAVATAAADAAAAATEKVAKTLGEMRTDQAALIQRIRQLEKQLDAERQRGEARDEASRARQRREVFEDILPSKEVREANVGDYEEERKFAVSSSSSSSSSSAPFDEVARAARDRRVRAQMLRRRENAKQKREERRREREREQRRKEEMEEERRRQLSPEQRKRIAKITERVERRAETVADRESAREVISSFHESPVGAQGRELSAGVLRAMSKTGISSSGGRGGTSSASGDVKVGGRDSGLLVDPVAVADAVAAAAGVSGPKRRLLKRLHERRVKRAAAYDDERAERDARGRARARRKAAEARAKRETARGARDEEEREKEELEKEARDELRAARERAARRAREQRAKEKEEEEEEEQEKQRRRRRRKEEEEQERREREKEREEERRAVAAAAAARRELEAERRRMEEERKALEQERRQLREERRRRDEEERERKKKQRHEEQEEEKDEEGEATSSSSLQDRYGSMNRDLLEQMLRSSVDLAAARASAAVAVEGEAAVEGAIDGAIDALRTSIEREVRTRVVASAAGPRPAVAAANNNDDGGGSGSGAPSRSQLPIRSHSFNGTENTKASAEKDVSAAQLSRTVADHELPSAVKRAAAVAEYSPSFEDSFALEKAAAQQAMRRREDDARELSAARGRREERRRGDSRGAKAKEDKGHDSLELGVTGRGMGARAGDEAEEEDEEEEEDDEEGKEVYRCVWQMRVRDRKNGRLHGYLPPTQPKGARGQKARAKADSRYLPVEVTVYEMEEPEYTLVFSVQSPPPPAAGGVQDTKLRSVTAHCVLTTDDLEQIFKQAAEAGISGTDADDACSKAESAVLRWLEEGATISRTDTIIFLARRCYLLFLPDGEVLCKVNAQQKM